MKASRACVRSRSPFLKEITPDHAIIDKMSEGRRVIFTH
jgi:hypothetical protein